VAVSSFPTCVRRGILFFLSPPFPEREEEYTANFSPLSDLCRRGGRLRGGMEDKRFPSPLLHLPLPKGGGGNKRIKKTSPFRGWFLYLARNRH